MKRWCGFINGPLLDKLPWLRDHLVSRARQIALEPAIADCTFMPTSGSHLLGGGCRGDEFRHVILRARA